MYEIAAVPQYAMVLAGDGSADGAGAGFAEEVGFFEEAGVGGVEWCVWGWGGVVFGAVGGEVGEICQAAAEGSAGSGAVAEDDISGDGDAGGAVGEEDGVFLGRVEDIIGEDHSLAVVP